MSQSQQQANSFTAQRIASGTVAAMGEGEGGGGEGEGEGNGGSGKLHGLNLRRRRQCWNAVYKPGEEEVAAGFQKKNTPISPGLCGQGSRIAERGLRSHVSRTGTRCDAAG